MSNGSLLCKVFVYQITGRYLSEQDTDLITSSVLTQLLSLHQMNYFPLTLIKPHKLT